MVLEATTIEDDGADASLFGSLSKSLSDLFSAINVAGGFQVFFVRTRGCQCGALRVVDNLSSDVLQASVYGESRLVRSTGDALPHTSMPSKAQFLSSFLCHYLRISLLLGRGALTSLQLDNFTLVANALALIRLWLSYFADVGGDLANKGLVDT